MVFIAERVESADSGRASPTPRPSGVRSEMGLCERANTIELLFCRAKQIFLRTVANEVFLFRLQRRNISCEGTFPEQEIKPLMLQTKKNIDLNKKQLKKYSNERMTFIWKPP